MNYYKHHLGDYAKKTGHLSMLEHGAYRLLLDVYYANEGPIPEGKVYRHARARTPAEKAAVDAVLEEFFHLEDGHWVNDKCEEEIPAAQAKIATARTNGKHGGRPRKKRPPTEPDGGNSGTPKKPDSGGGGTEEKPNGFSSGSQDETETKAPHSPYTNDDDDARARGVVSFEGEAGLKVRLLRRLGLDPGQPHRLAGIALPESWESIQPERLLAAMDAVKGRKNPLEIMDWSYFDREVAKELNPQEPPHAGNHATPDRYATSRAASSGYAESSTNADIAALYDDGDQYGGI